MSNRWHVEGTYLDSCNCETVCPCRSHEGRPGGDSTYDRCEFALSWIVDSGRFDDIDLSGRSVVLTGWYADDEPGSPWRVRLYVDNEASEQQVDALARIYLGQVGGHPAATYAAAIEEVVGVEPADITLEYSPRRWSSRVDGRVDVRASVPASDQGAVVCAISGPEHPGTEYTADVMRVTDDPFDWEVSGRASFVAPFAYSA
jgi:hypothetical protein